MQNALTINGLEKVYATGTRALNGVSLDIKKGDFFALLGPNGAGKTTIIGIITGLVDKTGGTVSIYGTDLDTNIEQAKSFIGVVPQEMNFNIFDKVIDIIINQAGYYGIPRSVAIPRAEQLLKELGLYEKRNDVSRTLSGGMKRRLMIARALIHEPQFLVLDEPTAGVDVELRRGMWDYLRTLNAKGTTILLTTHYLEEAEQLCKHIAIINKGGIVVSGSMKSVLGQLKKEAVLLDLALPVSDAALSALHSYHPKKVDDTTVEIEVGEGVGISKAIVALDNLGIPVQSVRAKSGRLEEVFMNLTAQPEE